MDPKDLDALLTSLRSAGVVKFEGFGVSVLLGPQAARAVAQVVAAPVSAQAPAPTVPMPITPTVADIEKLEAELFEGQI